jgi:periplasmic divalent cation tolerance protein
VPTVYVTAPPDAAEEIARELVEEGLAACVNRVDCRSTYRWEGGVHDDDEEILLAKTTEGGYARLVDRVESIHPYDVPCIERFDETDVLPAFAQWRRDAVGD